MAIIKADAVTTKEVSLLTRNQLIAIDINAEKESITVHYKIISYHIVDAEDVIVSESGTKSYQGVWANYSAMITADVLAELAKEIPGSE